MAKDNSKLKIRNSKEVEIFTTFWGEKNTYMQIATFVLKAFFKIRSQW